METGSFALKTSYPGPTRRRERREVKKADAPAALCVAPC